MSALTNAILSQYPGICGKAVNPLDIDRSHTGIISGAPRTIEHILIRGIAHNTNDVHWRDGEVSKIYKRMRPASLPDTVTKWLAQGREITGITRCS